MGVTVTKKALRDLLRNVLFEAVPSAGSGGSGQSRTMAAGDASSAVGTQAGMFDRPLKAKDETDINFQSTIPDEVPLHPSDMMATQLAEERPPIEDDEYVPTNVAELTRATAALAQMVPSDQVAYFYARVKEKVSEVEARALEQPTNETVVPLKVLADEMDDEAGLSDIMQVTGHSAESGARQYILRALDKLSYVTQEVDADNVDDLIAYGILEFVNMLLEDEAIDEEDVQELKMNPAEVEQLGFFKNFLTRAITLPAFQQLQRESKKRLTATLETMGIPSSSHNRIINFVMGAPPQDMEKIVGDMKADAITAGISVEEADSLGETFIQELPSLKKTAELEGDLVDIAKSRWERRSVGNKLDMLDKARHESLADMSSDQLQQVGAGD